MQELKGQINAVEDAQKPTAAPSTASVAQPGATEIGPKETSPKTNIDLYGFVMLDSGYGLGRSATDRHADERDVRFPAREAGQKNHEWRHYEA